MKQLTRSLLSFMIAVLLVCTVPTALIGGQARSGNAEVESMKTTRAVQQYNEMIGSLSTFPVSFVYDGTAHRGFGKNFRLVYKTSRKTEYGTENDLTLVHADGRLAVRLETAVYPAHGAYEWTVYFLAIGTEPTGLLEQVLAADLDIVGAEPVLKGIHGDYGYLYAPYAYEDLSGEGVSFTSTTGRPSHYTFPYYNLEHADGGAMIAVGWPGTYSVNFAQTDERTTHFSATGTVGLRTYLKPGETVRTPLMAFVLYEERDEDLATNAWRRWYLDCNLPKEGGERMEGKVTVPAGYYTGGDVSLKRTDAALLHQVEVMHENGVYPDVFWMDAGWYLDIYGKSVSFTDPALSIGRADWYRTGNWTIDPDYWSNTDRVSDQLHSVGGKSMLWFEPERVGEDNFVQLKNTTGIKPEWLLVQQNRSQNLVNLGIPEALEHMFGQICAIMDSEKIDYYREDFNMDPADNWLVGDALQGPNRKGITENLYVQGHLKLWDKILERYPNAVIDSCASGGGRNDLESMRRAVPYHRTDAEETANANRSISINASLYAWLPYFGARGYGADGRVFDEYASRAGFAGAWKIGYDWPGLVGTDFYDTIRAAIGEYDAFQRYLYSDYYLLTDWHSENDLTDWTAYEFFDSQKGSGVLQLFRQDQCEDAQKLLRLRGLESEAYYRLTRTDGSVVLERAKGKYLTETGHVFHLNTARSSDVIWIEQCK